MDISPAELLGPWTLPGRIGVVLIFLYPLFVLLLAFWRFFASS